ncbi:MAG: protein kinase, partial [bacterium]
STAFTDINLYLKNAYTFLTDDLNEQEKYDLALTTAQQALLIDVEFAPAFTALGCTYFNLHDWPAAINAFEKSIRLNTNQTVVWNKLGDAYLHTKEYVKSIEAYQHALSLDPDLKEAQVHLTIARSRANPDWWLQRFETIKSSGALKDAIELLQKAQAMYPEEEEISRKLQEASLELDYTHGLKALADENWHLALEIFQRLNPEYKDTALKLKEARTASAVKIDTLSADSIFVRSQDQPAVQLEDATKPSKIAQEAKKQTETQNKSQANEDKKLAIRKASRTPLWDSLIVTTDPLPSITALKDDSVYSALTTDSLFSLKAIKDADLFSKKVSVFLNGSNANLHTEGQRFPKAPETATESNSNSFLVTIVLWVSSILIGSLLIIGLTYVIIKNKQPVPVATEKESASNQLETTVTVEMSKPIKSANSKSTDEVFRDHVASITPIKFDPVETAGILNKSSESHKEKTSPIDEVSLQETRTILGGIKKVKRIGRYILEKEIGRGSMGLIYKAWDPKLDRTVVIKQVAFDFDHNSHDVANLKDRLFREARAAGRLNHPNIVIIYDVDEEENYSYIVMEFVQGRDLKLLLEQEKIFTLLRTTNIIRQICSALNFAHQNGIVHRDIKPSNIILTNHDKVKVADFGIAQVPHLGTLTQTGSIIGTPFYMSPEQIEGRKLDGRSDIFSVGVLLYEMLTALHPFDGENIPGVVYKIVHKEPKSPSQVNKNLPAALDKIVARALAKEPEERYATAHELSIDLEKVQENH